MMEHRMERTRGRKPNKKREKMNGHGTYHHITN
jgi:hypothetical protein